MIVTHHAYDNHTDVSNTKKTERDTILLFALLLQFYSCGSFLTSFGAFSSSSKTDIKRPTCQNGHATDRHTRILKQLF